MNSLKNMIYQQPSLTKHSSSFFPKDNMFMPNFNSNGFDSIQNLEVAQQITKDSRENMQNLVDLPTN
jgi:hypothetical protein